MEPLVEFISVIDQCLDGQWGKALITIGLLFDGVGAVLLASILFITREEASDRTGTRWGHGKSDPRRYETPAVKALLRDARRGKWGAALLASGFGLQILGLWL